MQACTNCLENKAAACDDCGVLTWNEDLEEHEADWFGKVQVLQLCAACAEKMNDPQPEESEEKEDESVTLDAHAQPAFLVAS